MCPWASTQYLLQLGRGTAPHRAISLEPTPTSQEPVLPTSGSQRPLFFKSISGMSTISFYFLILVVGRGGKKGSQPNLTKTQP